MKPGLVALFLVAVLSIVIGVTVDRESTILAEAHRQVVVVECPGRGYGTGWFVNVDYVVTAYHVVAGCPSIFLVRGPWNSTALLYAYSEERDIALLRVEEPPPWAEGLPLAFRVSLGDPVYIIGYPIQLYRETPSIAAMSSNPRVASGTVSWLNPTSPYFEFDTPTDAGNSGGPVVSKESGGVVGIVVYARTGVVSAGYFGLRMDYVAQFLDAQGVEYRVAGRPDAPVLAGIAVALAVLLAAVARGWRPR